MPGQQPVGLHLARRAVRRRVRVMDERDKVLAKCCVEYALVAGLTDEESAAVYRFIQPRIAASFCTCTFHNRAGVSGITSVK